MHSNTVYTVVLNYNGWRDTIECLESLLKTDYSLHKVVVVDNDSTDGSSEFIASWASGSVEAQTSDDTAVRNLVLPPLRKPISLVALSEEEALTSNVIADVYLIKAKKNNGFSAGNNIGMRFALRDQRCDFIWLLNNDTVIPPETLGRLVSFHHQKSPQTLLGIVGTRLLHYSSPSTQQAYAGVFNMVMCVPAHVGENEPFNLDLVYDKNKYDYVIGASMFVSVEYVKKIGLLDEGYFLYFEELDWTERGKTKGYTTLVADQTYIYHKHGASTGNKQALDRSLFSDQKIVESKVRFLKKHYPFLVFNLLITFPIVMLNRLRRGQGNRIFSLSKTLAKALFRS